jgi:hypothetical protein
MIERRGGTVVTLYVNTFLSSTSAMADPVSRQKNRSPRLPCVMIFCEMWSCKDELELE